MLRKFTFSVLTVLLAGLWSCESLDNAPQLTPDGQQVISKGKDLQEALRRGYATWWGSTLRCRARCGTRCYCGCLRPALG